jgi:hypothetical protein
MIDTSGVSGSCGEPVSAEVFVPPPGCVVAVEGVGSSVARKSGGVEASVAAVQAGGVGPRGLLVLFAQSRSIPVEVIERGAVHQMVYHTNAPPGHSLACSPHGDYAD